MAIVYVIPLISNDGVGGYAYDSDFDVDFMHSFGTADPFDSAPKSVVVQVPSYKVPAYRPVAPIFDATNTDSDYLRAAPVIVITPINFTNITAIAKQVSVNFDTPPTLLGPAADKTVWSIIGPNAQVITINTLNIIGTSVVLSTTEMSNGVTYTISIPPSYITSSSGLFWTGPFVKTFTGVGGAPFIQNVKPIDGRTIEIMFSENVNKYDALNIANYSIDHGLVVLGAQQISPSIFRLITSLQVSSTNYTVTASNIRDIDSVLI
jgi:hypothetical protein